ncbi:MAG: PEP-CTERM sorting domain-containing protein [Bryobacterales bacterium]|nr:PEP-CTERM sorting domain-containing protein [Bryobacterales bacterium]
MLKATLLALVLASTAQADLITIDLLAAFGQGVSTFGMPLVDFRQQGLKGPRSSSMTISGAAANNGTISYSYSGAGEPNASIVGLNIVFDSLNITSFTPGATNTWSFANGASSSSFSVYGNVSNLTGAPAGYNVLFTGTFGSGVDLEQVGGGTSVINQVGTASLDLSPTAAGLQFIQALTPGNMIVSNAILQGLSFIPGSSIGVNGNFTSTNANFLGGQLLLSTTVPEPASFMMIGLAGLAFGFLRLRRK